MPPSSVAVGSCGVGVAEATLAVGRRPFGALGLGSKQTVRRRMLMRRELTLLGLAVGKVTGNKVVSSTLAIMAHVAQLCEMQGHTRCHCVPPLVSFSSVDRGDGICRVVRRLRKVHCQSTVDSEVIPYVLEVPHDCTIHLAPIEKTVDHEVIPLDLEVPDEHRVCCINILLIVMSFSFVQDLTEIVRHILFAATEWSILRSPRPCTRF